MTLVETEKRSCAIKKREKDLVETVSARCANKKESRDRVVKICEAIVCN